MLEDVGGCWRMCQALNRQRYSGILSFNTQSLLSEANKPLSAHLQLMLYLPSPDGEPHTTPPLANDPSILLSPHRAVYTTHYLPPQ